MSNLKCPFCQWELYVDMKGECGCPNAKCQKSVFMFGSEELWQELIRTRKALDVAMGFIEKVRNNEDTHMFWIKVANDTLNKITALEQKDK